MSAAPPLLPGAAAGVLPGMTQGPEPEPEPAAHAAQEAGAHAAPAQEEGAAGDGNFSATMRRIRSDVLARGGANAALINAWQEVDTDGDDFLTYSVFAVRPLPLPRLSPR